MDLRNGDCLEVMKELEKDSVDLMFADLPYGQTSCKWDCLIDLELFWKEVNRVCKPDAPMVFTCSVKFGNSLINSNPKNFRYDLIWVKSAPCGFLNAKKMPMKKHEMIYVFYNKLPKVYTENIALHHNHKFLKETENKRKVGGKGCYTNGSKTETCSKYDPPLPNSVIKEENVIKYDQEHNSQLYGEKLKRDDRKNKIIYDPPLPNSIIKEENCKYDVNKNAYGGGKEGRIKISKAKREHEVRYEPPLPNSVIKEDTFIRGKKNKTTNNDVYNSDERFNNGKLYHHSRKLQKGDESIYEPPLPNSVIKEDTGVYNECDHSSSKKLVRDTKKYKNESVLYGEIDRPDFMRKQGESMYEPALPNSVIKEDTVVLKTQHKTAYGDNIHHHNKQQKNGESIYEPPLPNSILEMKSEKGKHATQKPVALMEWILKYYSREGGVVLDPTMGSGSMGVACGNKNRSFIGIEKDETIYAVALERCVI